LQYHASIHSNSELPLPTTGGSLVSFSKSISVNLQMFIATRFFIGFGVAIAHGSSPLLITELVHPQRRAILTTIFNTTWYFASIIAAWLTFGTNKISNDWTWGVPSIVQAFPSVLQLIFV
jgi:MFS family permease